MNLRDWQNPDFMQKAIDAAAVKTVASVVASAQPKNGRITVANNRGLISPSTSNSTNSQTIVGLAFLFVGGITLLMGLFNGDKAQIFVAIIGAIFALAGYCMFFSRDCFVFENSTGEWTIAKGILPFVKTQKGFRHDLAEFRIVSAIRTATENQEKGSTNTSVWRLNLYWSDTTKPPLELKGLDLATLVITEEQAKAAYKAVADVFGLPLVDAEPEANTGFPSPAVTVQPVEVSEFRLPDRPADSRIRLVQDPSARLHIELARKMSPVSLVGPLIPIIAFLWFLNSVRQSHDQFMQNVSPQSRQFFQQHSSGGVAFFIPFGIIMLFFTLLTVALIVGNGFAFRHIVLMNRELLTYRKFGQKLFGKRILNLDDLSGARSIDYLQDPKAKSPGLNTSARGKIYQTAMVYGPNQTDVPIGGEELSAEDFAWYLRALTGLVDGDRRENAIHAIRESMFNQPGNAITYRKAKTLLRPGVILGGLLLLSLANSYGGGVGRLTKWRNSAGAHGIYWNSLWKQKSVTIDAQDRVQQYEATYTPWSSSTSGSDTGSTGVVIFRSGAWMMESSAKVEFYNINMWR
ncbi:MAG: hypothetical protein ABJA67_13400 [Chthonomonadales bacterium]